MGHRHHHRGVGSSGRFAGHLAGPDDEEDSPEVMDSDLVRM